MRLPLLWQPNVGNMALARSVDGLPAVIARFGGAFPNVTGGFGLGQWSIRPLRCLPKLDRRSDPHAPPYLLFHGVSEYLDDCGRESCSASACTSPTCESTASRFASPASTISSDPKAPVRRPREGAGRPSSQGCRKYRRGLDRNWGDGNRYFLSCMSMTVWRACAASWSPLCGLVNIGTDEMVTSPARRNGHSISGKRLSVRTSTAPTAYAEGIPIPAHPGEAWLGGCSAPALRPRKDVRLDRKPGLPQLRSGSSPDDSPIGKAPTTVLQNCHGI